MVEAIRLRARGVRGDHEQGGAELKVVPIVGPSHDEPAYRLLEDDVLEAVSVTEVSEGGSVPELIVHNPLDVMVYLLDGQELIGAKQNRILNTDVLVPAGATLRIPVSCVEQGRWNYVSDKFSPSRRTASHRTRRDKLARVHKSLACDAGHDADQGAVWEEVRMELESTGSVSDTGALHAAYEQREADLAALRQDLRLPDDAVGLAIFDGTGFQGLDLFDRHGTLVYFWQSLLDSYALSWLGRRGNAEMLDRRGSLSEHMDSCYACAPLIGSRYTFLTGNEHNPLTTADLKRHRPEAVEVSEFKWQRTSAAVQTRSGIAGCIQ